MACMTTNNLISQKVTMQFQNENKNGKSCLLTRRFCFHFYNHLIIFEILRGLSGIMNNDDKGNQLHPNQSSPR